MTNKLLRRTFLISAGGAGALGLFSALKKFAGPPEDLRPRVQAIIYRNIPGITFHERDLDLFVEDLATIPRPKSLSYDWLKNAIGETIDSDFVAMTKNPMLGRVVAAYEGPIMTAFFMATDFFPDGYQRGRRIKFIRPSDPYLAKCGNPLANLDLAGDEPHSSPSTN